MKEWKSVVTGSATKEYRNEIVGKKRLFPGFLVRVNCIVREVTRFYELHLESWMEINV